MHPITPGIRCLTAIAVSFAASSVAFDAAALTCEEKCEQAYSNCAAVEAAGCELGADLAGAAASKLGEQIPIPGMGALFGGLTKKGTKEACLKKLAPCDKIKETCLSECGGSAEAPGGAAPGTASAPVGPVRKATFRVFSDRPRTIVYINGERMGATPSDPLEPFITPELRVGKYWVRMVTPDEEWAWEGAKDVEEGNVNAVEGKLENVEDKAWAAALSLDRQGETVRAMESYGKFVDRFPDSERVSTAMERISALRAEVAAAERELFERIENEEDPETRIALCHVYIKGFADGPRRSKVDEILAASLEEFNNAKREADAYASVIGANDHEFVIKWGERYLSDFPDGPHAAEVEELVEAARMEIARAELAKERESIGEAQRGWGVALMTIGGAAGVTGGILGGVTLSQYNDLKDDCGQTVAGCDVGDRDDNYTKAVVTNWLLGAGLVSLTTGIIVYATAPKWEEEPPVTAVVAPTPDGNGAAFAISGSF